MAFVGDNTPHKAGANVIMPGFNFLARIQIPAAVSTMHGVWFFGRVAPVGAGNAEAVVYADAAGVPGALLATGTPGGTLIPQSINPYWYHDNLLLPLVVIPGNFYWAGFVSGGGNPIEVGNSGAPGPIQCYSGPDPGYPPPTNPEPGLGGMLLEQHGFYIWVPGPKIESWIRKYNNVQCCHRPFYSRPCGGP